MLRNSKILLSIFILSACCMLSGCSPRMSQNTAIGDIRSLLQQSDVINGNAILTENNDGSRTEVYLAGESILDEVESNNGYVTVVYGDKKDGLYEVQIIGVSGEPNGAGNGLNETLQFRYRHTFLHHVMEPYET